MTARILGICGRKRSGKDTIARIIAWRFDAKVFHFASSLKGLAFLDLAIPLSFCPYMCDEARRSLQAVAGHGRQINADVFVNFLLTLLDGLNCQRVVIADVRFVNEAEAIRREGGVVIKLLSSDHSDNHPSEQEVDLIQAPAFYASALLRSDYKAIEEIVRDLTGWKPVDRKLKIYIATNISGEPNWKDRLRNLARLVAALGPFEPLLCTESLENEIKDWDWFLARIKDGGMLKASNELVSSDLKQLGKADAVLAYLTSPSIGVMTEVTIATMMNKPVVVATEHSLLTYHPWLWAMTQGNVFCSPEQAITRLKQLFLTGITSCF